MKALIDKKIYDTDSATKLAGWENMPDSQDFRYQCERLFRTKNGTLFIHAEGGAKTALARHEGSTSYSGEQIFPLTTEQAVEWCARTRNTECALKHFGDALQEA